MNHQPKLNVLGGVVTLGGDVVPAAHTLTGNKTMTKKQKMAKLNREAPEEVAKLLMALKLIKKMDGLSISGDDHTLSLIRKGLDFKSSTPEGVELKKNLLKKAKAKSREGMDGEGTFFID